MATNHSMGGSVKDVAIALQGLSRDEQRRVLVACLILLGHKVPLEFLEMDEPKPETPK